MREAAFNNEIQVSSVFDSDPDMLTMRKPFTRDFISTYDKAFKLYVDGKWSEAKSGFEQVLAIRDSDPLSRNLLKFMSETNYVAPSDWKGYKFFSE